MAKAIAAGEWRILDLRSGNVTHRADFAEPRIMCQQNALPRLKRAIYVSILVLNGIQTHTQDFRDSRHLYSSFTTDLRDLEIFEFKVAKHLTEAFLGSNILPIGSEIRGLVHSYLTDFYQTTGYSNIKDVIGKEETGASRNPICAYRLIRRVKFLLQHLTSHKLFPLKFGQLWKEIVSFFWKNGWLLYEDLKIASQNILRIQHVYDLRAEEFANGWTFDLRTNCTMNSINCYEIANFAQRSDRWSATIEWLEVAKEKCVVDKKASLPFIWFSLRNAIDKHNSAFGRGNKGSFFKRKIRHIPGDGKKAQTIRSFEYKKFKGNKGKAYESVNYWGLCSGENFQTEKEKSSLFCWHEFKFHPSLKIGPMKMEFLARNPDVVQIYEVLQETELSRINSGSSLRNFVSNIEKPGNILDDQSSYISSKASISTLHNSTMERVFMRKTHQVRDDVEKGGETAFTSLGVAAKPVKGSVVFWHNLLQDGSPDEYTTHRSCPVLLGEKIVARKPILLNELLRARKCSLNPKDRFQIPVNDVLHDSGSCIKVNIANYMISKSFNSLKYLPAPYGSRIENDANEQPPPKYPNNDASKLSEYSFIAPHGIKALVQFEWTIYPRIKYLYHKYRNQTMGTFREEFDRQNNDVKMYLEEFENFTISVLGSLDSLPIGNSEMAERISWNPLAAYRLVNRVMVRVQTWARQRPTPENKLKKRIRSYLTQVYNISDGPTESDFEAAMFAVVNIHYIHGLPVEDIANGIVKGIDAKVRLNARDCYYIGIYGASLEYFATSIEWLEHALLLVTNTSDKSVSYEEVYDTLATIQIKQECYYGKWTQICETREGSGHPASEEVTDVGHVKFWGLCKGKVYQKEVEKSKLFCWYEREIHPSYKIGPIKAEWISLHPKPNIVQYYDVISDRIIDALKNFTYENAARDVFMYNNSYIVAPLLRQVIYAWADPAKNEASLNVSKLTERITGLKVVDRTQGLNLRVTGYVPGSYRDVHVDTRTEMHVATFMLYLSDVVMGGETPFATGGVNVVPRKGSVVFWYNLFSDGLIDESTDHGGCPVVFGEKWVALRWILYESQDHLKCDLKPRTPYRIPVNGKHTYFTNNLEGLG